MTGSNGAPDRRYEFGQGAVELLRNGEVVRVVVSGDLDMSTVERVRAAVERTSGLELELEVRVIGEPLTANGGSDARS